MNATISSIVSVTLGQWSTSSSPKRPVSSRYHSVASARALGARTRGRLVDLVVDVRDVVDERDVVAALAQPALVPAREHVRARVADVGARVDGRAADVHADRARRLGELGELAGEGVIEPHRPASAPRPAGAPRSRPTAPARARRRSGRAAAPSGRRRPPSARGRCPCRRARCARSSANRVRVGLASSGNVTCCGSRIAAAICACLDEVARAAKRARELRRRPGAGGELLVARAIRSRRSRAAGSAARRGARRAPARRAPRGRPAAPRRGRLARGTAPASARLRASRASSRPRRASRPWWTYSGGSKPSARESSRCSSVFERWSAPRTTCVISKSWSSTTLAR